MKNISHIGTTLQIHNLMNQINHIFPRLSGSNAHGHTVMKVGENSMMTHIDQIYTDLKEQHPEAGKMFWSCRTWSLLIWQAIYVSILSTHLLKKSPCLQRFGLKIQAESHYAYTLSSYPILQATEKSMMMYSGEQIHRLCHILYTGLTSITPLSIKLAQKLQTDCMVSALLFVSRLQNSNQQHHVDHRVKNWLMAAKLPLVQGTLMLPNTEPPRFAIHRQACCQEFRLEGSVLCDACPRHTIDKRIELMTNT